MSVSLPQRRRGARSTAIDSSRQTTTAAVLAEARDALSALRAPLEGGLQLDDSAHAFLGALFLVRTVRNLTAVLTLCEAGWAPEAQTLLRAMVEDMVTVAYISTQPEKLSRDWLSFENRRLPDQEQVMAAFAGEPMPAREEKPKYDRWTRLSFNAMAKRAEATVPGLMEYLGYVYPILSDRAHGNTSASGIYVRVHAGGAVEPLYHPSENQVAITVCNAVTASYTMAERIRSLGVQLDLAEFEAAERRAYHACGLTGEPHVP